MPCLHFRIMFTVGRCSSTEPVLRLLPGHDISNSALAGKAQAPGLKLATSYDLDLIYNIQQLFITLFPVTRLNVVLKHPALQHHLLQVEVHWSGYTAGYQGKRIDNTSVRDEPYRFRVGSGEVCIRTDPILGCV